MDGDFALRFSTAHTLRPQTHFQPSPHIRWIHVFSRGLVFFGALPSSGCGPFSTSTTRPLLWPGGYTAFTPGRGGLSIRMPSRRDFRFAADAGSGVFERPVKRREARLRVWRIVHWRRFATMNSTMLATEDCVSLVLIMTGHETYCQTRLPRSRQSVWQQDLPC